jgi:hypothetical protein
MPALLFCFVSLEAGAGNMPHTEILLASRLVSSASMAPTLLVWRLRRWALPLPTVELLLLVPLLFRPFLNGRSGSYQRMGGLETTRVLVWLAINSIRWTRNVAAAL